VVACAGLSYVNNVQFRRDAQGDPRLLEVNPRIPGTIGLTVQAGLNLPLAACCLALGERLSLPEPELGLRAIRHGEVLYTLRRFGRGDESSSASTPGSLTDLIVGEDPVFVLWDLDGTLVKLDVPLREIATWKEQLQVRFEPFGWTGGWSPLLPSLEAALALAAASLADDEAQALCTDVYARLDEWEAAAVRDVEVVVGVVELLTVLSRCEVHMGLVSNNGPAAVALGLAVLDEHLTALGSGTTGLSAVVCRAPGRAAKPAGDPLAEAVRQLERQHGEPMRVVYIGDSPGDLAASRALFESSGLPVDFLFVG
jgi:phosphoglycolate phosphatase-like HAD superfamily hydrolase